MGPEVGVDGVEAVGGLALLGVGSMDFGPEDGAVGDVLGLGEAAAVESQVMGFAEDV